MQICGNRKPGNCLCPILLEFNPSLLDSTPALSPLADPCSVPRWQGWLKFQSGAEGQGKMRFETVDPAFGGDGGENIVHVRGYSFPEGKKWQIQFGEQGDLTCEAER